MRRFTAIILTISLLFSLSGCSALNTDSQTLMAPPKSDADQQAIYSLMSDADGDVNFVYPKNGNYRSAVIYADFTGDGISDAMGFTTDAETGGSILHFLRKKDGVWENIGSFPNSAPQVDRVIFTDLTGDGRKEIVVSWGSVQSMTAAADAYYYKSGNITESLIASGYGEICCDDIDKDGRDELFCASIYTPPETEGDEAKDAEGFVYDCAMKSPQLQYSVKLSNDVTRYLSASYHPLNAESSGFILECVLADGSYITQLVSLSSYGNGIAAPLSYSQAEKSFSYFRRPAGFPLMSQDINGDGYLDFPLLSPVPGHKSDETGSDAFYVNWTKLFPSIGEGDTIKTCIYNSGENYRFDVPTDKKKSYSCKINQAQRELSFTFVEVGVNGIILYSKKLFTIKTFSFGDWMDLSEEQKFSYKKLSILSGDTVYAATVYENSTECQEILDSFILVNQ